MAKFIKVLNKIDSPGRLYHALRDYLSDYKNEDQIPTKIVYYYTGFPNSDKIYQN